jgi:predicted N-acetyltransferase YhbS
MPRPARKSTADSMLIIAPDRRTHRAEMFDLIAKTFGSYFGFHENCVNGYIDNSHYDWDASRIGLLDGRIVTHYGVWDYQMRIGSARVRTAGVGAVATHGQYRKHGLMAKTAQACVDALAGYGYDMTVLFGIKNFYHRFGYVRAWKEMTWTVSPDDLPKDKPKVRLRTFKPHRRRDDIEAVYNRDYANLTGTAVRPNYQRRRPGRKGFLWTDSRGRTTGYVAVGTSQGKMEVGEVGGDAKTILRVLGMLARKAGAFDVRFLNLHYLHPVCKLLRCGTCKCEVSQQANGGPMIRTINLASTLGKMVGELSRRLKASALAGWRGNLLVADPREKVSLTIDRSKVSLAGAAKSTHALVGGEEIAQLILGSDEPCEIVEASGTKLSGNTRLLATTMFPNQWPNLCAWDRY